MIKGTKVLNIHAQRTLDLAGKDNITVTWHNIVPGVFPSQFNVYQSIGGKDYTKLGDTQIDSYSATGVESLPGVAYFYKVTFTENGTESDLDLATAVDLYSWDAEGVTIYDQMARAQALRSRWLIENWGENCVIYVRKFAGTRCPKCYDEVGNMSTNNTCSICYGTGWEGGFVKFNKKIAIEMASDKRLSTRPWGYEQTWQPRANFDNFPIIHSQDIIGRADNVRYLITSTNPVRLNNVLYQQICGITEAQLDNICYSLP